MRFLAFALAGGVVCAVALSSVACHSARDADQETLEHAKSMISLDSAPMAHVTGRNQIEVDGTATNHDKFQHDVYFTATLWDAKGTAVGTATGKLEDWPAGHHGAYKLIGSTTSPNWTRVSVVVSNVQEHVRGQTEQ
ncbi:MAG: FxLYD domain-containing protein [Terriglobia bacterium]